jgi:hypothetical protein
MKPLESSEGSSIFSQPRIVMLYGFSKPSSTSLKPTNECLECQSVGKIGGPFTTGCIRTEGRPTRLYREDVKFMCMPSGEVGLEHIPGEYTVSRGVLHGFPT